MKIKLYRSSTIGINFGNFKLLQDPWLTDGEYYGSWSHYPHFDLKKNLSEINSYDAIYVSHIHLDHCSDKTIDLISKKIPIYIHKFHSKFLKNKLTRFGFQVYELEQGQNIEIGGGVNLKIFAADNCNPELCYKFFGCANFTQKDGSHEKKGSQQIDTVALINYKNKNILNVNDCPYELAKSTFENIKKNCKKIDLLLTGYQVSGAYPQCFDNLNDDQKITEGKRIGKIAFKKALGFIEDLKPEFFLPFAGAYSLSGKLSVLDKLRGAPNIDDAYKFLEKNNCNSKPIYLNPDGVFCLNTKKTDQKYEPFCADKYNNYLINKLSKLKFDYEDEALPTFEEIKNLSITAYEKFLNKRKFLKIELKTNIYISIYEKLILLPSNIDKKIKFLDKENFNDNNPYIIYSVDPRLLKKLLMGPRYAHWNNAEIGSHLRIFRNPNIYERNVWGSMCYFHN